MTKIILKHVSVEFPIYGVSSRSFKTSFVRMATGGLVAQDQHHLVVKGLTDINWALAPGDRVALLGHNGAGKSTMLRLLAGIYEPSSGNVTIDGKITPMLDIYSGVEAECTGYENIIARLLMKGLSKREVLGLVDEIATFSGLGDYLHLPLRVYSTGMQMRLAFAIATSVAADILLVDEILTAGDSDFIMSATQRIRSLIDKAHIVVVATHVQDMVREVCNKVLWLEAGQIKFFGEFAAGLELYNSGKSN